jgi:hypothetical protein
LDRSYFNSRRVENDHKGKSIINISEGEAGNLGTPYDAAPDDYVADWGKFGKISWTVK